MADPVFRYPVYDPCYQVFDAAWDWGFVHPTQDAGLALAQPFSVACVRVFYDQPWIFSYDAAIADVDLSKFDLVVVSDNEYFPLPQVREWIRQHSWSRYVLATAGKNPRHEIDSTREIYRSYVLKNFLRKNPDFVDTRASVKNFLFDALLGARRPHRDYVMLALTKTGLLDRTITTYRSGFPGAVVDFLNQESQRCFPDLELAWPYVSPHLDPAWEVAKHVNNQISHVSPIEIYRRCWYSIICETLCTGDTFFLSEKTIKAMFNQRFFVMFAIAGYLEQLKTLGFSTFGNFIDESFDREPRDMFRYRAAFAQIMQMSWFESPANTVLMSQGLLKSNQARLYSLELQEKHDMCMLLLEHIPSEHWSY